MRRGWRRFLKIAGVSLLALVALLAALAFWWVRRPWPEVDGSLTVAGLEAPVEVVRDRWGVPHLFAAGERDLLFAQGYVQAQDRLWQMEFNRRVASGTLGEVLGEPLLGADRFLRTLGLRRAAERDWQELGPEARGLLEAFAAGVNRFVDDHRDRLPLELTLLGVEPQPWTPIDSLAFGKLLALNVSLNQFMETFRLRLAAELGEGAVAELVPPYPADGPVIVHPGASPRTGVLAAARAPSPPALPVPGLGAGFWASNSWVVSGARSSSGRPLLANDTHLGLALPSIWYETGLHGGRFASVGFSFPGLPLVVIGHNERIAWGITNLCADVQDFFFERLDDPGEPRRYEVDGAWRELETVHETIALKGAAPVPLEVHLTHHGPLMNSAMPDELTGFEPLSLAWTALDGGPLVEALIDLNLAQDWTSFHEALRRWVAPSLNFTYADVDGNIAYQATGRVPIRAPGDDGLAPTREGWLSANDWQGFIPYDELPTLLNPQSGFIVTANHRVTGDDYPYHLAYDMADAYRAERINRVLAAGGPFGIEDFRRLHADVESLPARDLLPLMLDVEPQRPLARQALAEVRAWDGQLATDRVGAATFETWVWHLWSDLLADELGEELMKMYRLAGASQIPALLAILRDPTSHWIDDITTPEHESRADILARSLDHAVDWLGQRYGDDPAGWTWGRVHTMTFRHTPLGQSGIAPLEALVNSATLPLPGDVFTVDQSMPDLNDPFAVTFGVSQRMIVDLGDLGRSLAVNSTGQSGHLFHRHREDQIPLWAKVDYHPMPGERDAVLALAESTLRLVPAP